MGSNHTKPGGIVRPITRSPDHPITRSPDHPITRSPDHPITRSPDHAVTDDQVFLSLRLLVDPKHISTWIAEVGCDLRCVGTDWLDDLTAIGFNLLDSSRSIVHH